MVHEPGVLVRGSQECSVRMDMGGRHVSPRGWIWIQILTIALLQYVM